MGLDCTFRVIPANEYRKYLADRQHYILKSVSRFQLFREWVALDGAMNELGGPLGRAIRGNRPQHFAFDDDWDCYFAFVTPGLVKRIRKALDDISNDEFLRALKATGWHFRKREHKGYIGTFETLKAAYREATKQAACLEIFIC